MTCCAADARPIGVLIRGQTDLPEMTWIKVVGRPAFPMEGGKTIAIVEVDTVEKAAPPEETMLY